LGLLTTVKPPALRGRHDYKLRKIERLIFKVWQNKGFKEERMTKVGFYAIGKSTTLESNKSLPCVALPLPLHVGWDTALFAGKYPMFT
jgi:hypothetical protein